MADEKIKKNQQGEAWSVGKIYWIGVFIVSAVIRGISKAAEGAMFTAMAGPDAVFWTVFIAAVIVAVGIYYFFIGRAIYRAMYRNRRPTFWSWFGCVHAYLGVVGTIAGLAVFLGVLPGVPVSTNDVRLEVEAVRRGLPFEVEQGLNLIDVRFEDQVFIYEYEMEGSAFYLVPRNIMEELDGPAFCSDFEDYFRGPVAEVHWVYRLEDGQIIDAMIGSECLEWIDSGRPDRVEPILPQGPVQEDA